MPHVPSRARLLADSARTPGQRVAEHAGGATCRRGNMPRPNMPAANPALSSLGREGFRERLVAEHPALPGHLPPGIPLFGIRVPENFDWPYLRTNITEFWRHWHMSLTSWLIDYIYIPLGGSRRAAGQVYANILVTMLVSGLWHGAGVNFIVWGLLHGVMLVIRRMWRQIRPLPEGAAPPAWSQVGSGLLTFAAVNFAWAFFCMDVHTAVYFFRRLLIG